MLDVSISTYGNKGNKQLHIRNKPINNNFHYPDKSNLLPNRYIQKLNNWIAHSEYLKATGKRSLLAEDYYIW